MTAGSVRAGLERDPRRDIALEGCTLGVADAVAAAVDLAFTWGTTFALNYRGGVWSAERWDGTGNVISALNPRDLAVRMRAAHEGSSWW